MPTPSTPSPTPPSPPAPPRSPARAGVTLLAVAGIVAAAIALALVPGSSAGADELVRYDSCEALADGFGASADGAGGVPRDDMTAAAREGAAELAARATSPTMGFSATDSSADTGGTTTSVAGIDELDRVDVLGDRVLAIGIDGRLHLIDPDGPTVLDRLALPGADARLTADPGSGQVWVLSSGVSGTGLPEVHVTSVVVEGDRLVARGDGRFVGVLVDARRAGDRLHVVVVDAAGQPVPLPEPLPEPPVTTEPPVTEPPVAEPPVTIEPLPEPPAATEPSTTEPPVTTEPPTVEPQPAPAVEPDAASTAGRSSGDGTIEPDASIPTTSTTPDTPGAGDSGSPGDAPASSTSASSGADSPAPGPVAEPADPTAGRLPFTDPAGGVAAPGPCDQVWHPAGTPSGATALLVATFEGDATAPVATAQVVGGGELVHATDSALYVATAAYDGAGPATTIHRFALDDLTWTGSGRVPGMLLNTYAMSDHDGVLRVAVTAGGGWAPVAGDVGVAVPVEGDPVLGDVDAVAAEPAGGASSVITLDTEGGLDQIGRLDGLGKPGELIEGVRFAGDVAYVVTFRQTDPLYVVDLSDPARPRRTGEVELGGFSAYLHPVGDGRLVGIGPAGTLEGLTGGVAATLFDVADPTRPSVLDTVALGDESEAVWDPHALADLGGGALAVPVTDYGPTTAAARCDGDVCTGDVGFSAAAALKVRLIRAAGATLVDGGSLDVRLPLDGYPSWTRTVAVGDGLLVLTDSTVSAFDTSGAATGSASLAP